MSRHPLVSVIVAYFEQQAQLDRTLLALSRQAYPADHLEIIVVDDGSRVSPTVPGHVRLLRQEDRGFRLAAARNLGAAAAGGSVLCFLDADTAPEPDYVRELTREPAASDEVVAVGLRRHADWACTALADRVEIAGPPHELPAPAWLALAYERTRDLRDADHRSYRYLIGAVLACSRAFFAEVGGFDESFTDYGGEDWEWGYRAWLAGATFAHVPTAVAWHDGPDWSGRSVVEALAAKNREAMRLTSAIPTAGSRGRGLLSGATDTVVEIAASGSAPALFVCVDSVLEGMPHALVVVPPDRLRHFAGDPRVRADFSAADHPLVRVTVRMAGPVRVEPAGFAVAVEGVGSGATPDLLAWDIARRGLVEIRSTRTDRRRRRGVGVESAHEVLADWIRPIGGEPDLEAYLGGWG